MTFSLLDKVNKLYNKPMLQKAYKCITGLASLIVRMKSNNSIACRVKTNRLEATLFFINLSTYGKAMSIEMDETICRICDKYVSNRLEEPYLAFESVKVLKSELRVEIKAS